GASADDTGDPRSRWAASPSSWPCALPRACDSGVASVPACRSSLAGRRTVVVVGRFPARLRLQVLQQHVEGVPPRIGHLVTGALAEVAVAAADLAQAQAVGSA